MSDVEVDNHRKSEAKPKQLRHTFDERNGWGACSADGWWAWALAWACDPTEGSSSLRGKRTLRCAWGRNQSDGQLWFLWLVLSTGPRYESSARVGVCGCAHFCLYGLRNQRGWRLELNPDGRRGYQVIGNESGATSQVTLSIQIGTREGSLHLSGVGPGTGVGSRERGQKTVASLWV